MNEHPENENDEFDEDDFDFEESEFDFDDEEFGDEFDEEFDEEPKEQVKKGEETAPEEKPGEETLEQEHEEVKEQVESPAAPKAELPIGKAEQATEILSPEEIPLSISIELGRLQMSIKKLMELEPGNLIDLGITPEQGVDLIVGGKCIARGELLKVGDMLGVRILEKS